MVNENDPQWELLKMYASGPDKLEAFVHNLPEEAYNKRLADTEWTIQEYIHHIVDGDDIWVTCIKAALGNPHGEFSLQWYWDLEQLEWSTCWQYGNRSIATSLALYRANRAQIVEILHFLQDSWDKKINIRWPGDNDLPTISVDDVIKMHVNHLAGHLKDMESILQTNDQEQY
jgi:uncharacterized damage-inducible protein DinB